MNPAKTESTFKTTLDIGELPRADDGWCLTLYVPFLKNWREPFEDDVLVNDQLRMARKALESRGVDVGETEALLAPLREILEIKDASLFRGEGMALLSTRLDSAAVLLAKAPPALVEADERFRLDYLLSTLQGRDRFHLLCLGLKSVELWDCDGISMRRIPLEGVETDIHKTGHFRNHDFGISFRTKSGSAGGKKSKGKGSVFFGQGPGRRDGKEMKKEIGLFFRSIDAAILPELADRSVPLILAGVDYLLHLFREVNTYPNLMESQITGSPEALRTSEELHAAANVLMRERERDERNRLLGLYRENLATSRTVSGFTDVVPSACHRKLTHLFVREGARQWGSYDHDSGKTVLLEEYAPGAVNLVNLATLHTLQSQGSAFLVPEGEMPADSEIAGLLRD